MHVHLYINGNSVMLSDAFPEHGCAVEKPQGFNVTLPVDNIDTRFQRAIEAGATGPMPVADMLWGDRYGQLRDPFGVVWAMNQRKGIGAGVDVAERLFRDCFAALAMTLKWPWTSVPRSPAQDEIDIGALQAARDAA